MQLRRTSIREVFDHYMVKPVLLGATAALVVIMIGTTGNGDADQSFIADAPGGSNVFPSESLSDWVSYAQQMSVVTAIGEERIEPPARVYERNEGYVGRTVTVRVEKNVWHTDGVDPFAVGTELSYMGWGWLYKNSEYTPFAQQLKLGERYLMPIVKGLDAKYPLTAGYPLTADTRLPLEGNRVDPDIETNNPAVKLTIGKTVDEVGEMLEQASPDPLALKYWHLDPVDRVQAVLAEMYPPEMIEEPIPEITEATWGS